MQSSCKLKKRDGVNHTGSHGVGAMAVTKGAMTSRINKGGKSNGNGAKRHTTVRILANCGEESGHRCFSPRIPKPWMRKYTVGPPYPPPAGTVMTSSWTRPETRNPDSRAWAGFRSLVNGRKRNLWVRSRKARFQRFPQKSDRERVRRGAFMSAGAFQPLTVHQSARRRNKPK